MVCTGLTINQFPLISEEITRGLIEIVISGTYIQSLPTLDNAQQYRSLRAFLEKNNVLFNCSTLFIWKSTLEPEGVEFESECIFTTSTKAAIETSSNEAPPTEDRETTSSAKSSYKPSTTTPTPTTFTTLETSTPLTNHTPSSPANFTASLPTPGLGGGVKLAVKLGVGIALGVVGLVGVGVAGVVYLKTCGPGAARRRRGRAGMPARGRIYTGDSSNSLAMQMINPSYDESEI